MAKENPLEGRVALVTGASRGIGLEIARRLGRLGARLALCARHPEPLARAVETLRKEGIETAGIPADVSNAGEVAELVRRANEALGEIDVLVNNAGIGRFAPLYEVSEEDWDRVIATNMKGAFLCSKAVAPQMIRRRSGHIINIASLAGKNAFAGGGVYCASKWGLLGMTYCLAEDLRSYGIRTSAICPGTVQTDFSHSPHVGKDSTKMLQPEDVAHVVEMILLQEPQSFISEVLLRPTQKP
jgi:NAD(P)-dependent dehydrogenase (short-subunit alcohol dehydrogenase family)